MTTTKTEKEILLRDAKNIMRMEISNQRTRMSPDDFEELENDCLLAASRAIDDYDRTKGASIGVLIFRYIVQARRTFIRNRIQLKRDSTGRDAVCFTDCTKGVYDIPEGDYPTISETAAIIADRSERVQQMEIVIDMARNDDVISEREYQVLTMRRKNYRQEDIADRLGCAPSRIGQLEADAVGKIRRRYKTAE